MQLNGYGAIQEIIRKNQELYTIFKSCPLAVLEKIQFKSFAAGEFLLVKDEPSNYFYIIIEGSLAIHNLSRQGKRYVIGIYQPGMCIGELEIMDEQPCVSNVQARTAVKTLRVARQDYFFWLDNDRNFSRFILQTLCRKMYKFTQSTTSNTLDSLPSRLAVFMLDNLSDGAADYLGYTVEEMADIMGVTTRSISRTIKELREAGIVRQDGHRLQVIDRNRLDELRS